MVHRAPFRNKVLLFFLAMLVGCNSNDAEREAISKEIIVGVNDQRLTSENDIVMIGTRPFTGKAIFFYYDSKDTAEVASYRNGKQHGESRKFYPSGKIKEKRFFENGKKIGEYRTWWENGNNQLQYFFVADEYEGTCREWDENGKLVKIMNYRKGHEEGEQKWWYENGKIKANYVVKNGRRYGLLGTKNCINVSDSVFNR